MTILLTLYAISFLGSFYYSVSRLNDIITTGQDPYIEQEDIDLIRQFPLFQKFCAFLFALIPGFNTYSMLTFVFHKEDV